MRASTGPSGCCCRASRPGRGCSRSLERVRITIRHHFDFGADRERRRRRPRPARGLGRAAHTDRRRLRSRRVARGARARAAEARRRSASARGRSTRWLEQNATSARSRRTASAAACSRRWLQRLRPERRLLLAEYAPETVERLRALFPGAEVRPARPARRPAADGGRAPLPPRRHRADRRAVARGRCGASRARRVLVVATEVATPRAARCRSCSCALRSRRLTRAGWLRTRGAFEALWRDTHDARAAAAARPRRLGPDARAAA